MVDLHEGIPEYSSFLRSGVLCYCLYKLFKPPLLNRDEISLLGIALQFFPYFLNLDLEDNDFRKVSLIIQFPASFELGLVWGYFKW